MIKYFFILFSVFCSFLAFSQVKEFDKLEKLYDQQHYKIVYKKSKKLLNNPKYDYSLLPLYYKTLTQLQLSQDKTWLKRNPKAIDEAIKSYLSIQKNSDGVKIFNAHYYEIIYLKRDLINWLEELKKEGNHKDYDKIQNFLSDHFEEIPDIENEVEIENNFVSKEINTNETESLKKKRQKIIETSKKHLGTPYVVSGQTPNGFDCSGFSSFIYKEVDVQIPRSARDQFLKSTKIKEKEAIKGDLIFFTNGSFISHVGIIISNPNEPLTMIHASSTKGIVITDITKSNYWQKKIAGFGRFLTEK